jgi:hypothetical protein
LLRTTSNCRNREYFWNCTTRNICCLYLLKYSGTVENAIAIQNG